MTDGELIEALRHMAPETGSLHCLGCGYECSCSLRGCAIIRAAAERIAQLLAESEVLRNPPNPPLTLDELREMDGEPVWVVHPHNAFDPCWMLVMRRHNFVMANWQFCDFRDYSKTWLAYRRKREEVA